MGENITQKKKRIIRLHNATENLVNQQFYLQGKDIIIGRTPEIQVKIQYSGQIISKFKHMFKDNINLFLNQDYFQFLKTFTKIHGITEPLINEIYENLKVKLDQLEENLDDSDDSLMVLYTIVLSAIITKIREIHFEKCLQEIRKKLKKQNPAFKKKNIEKELTYLFMRNNKNISILYNLSYLRALAQTFNYKKVKRVCSIQRTKFINNTVKKIISRLK
ncbi:MAG: hypothetical protein R6U96_03105 [Promethearchaeia archaeon]